MTSSCSVQLVEFKGQSMLLLRVVITIYYMYARVSTAQIETYKIVLAVPLEKIVV